VLAVEEMAVLAKLPAWYLDRPSWAAVLIAPPTPLEAEAR
jgi:hypothetical protein